jgi:hypothetical protein
MEKAAQQQAEQAQKQAEIQQQLLEAQTNLATSQSLQQVAGAKERFTRSVANLGLEDERSSEAVQNRTQAVLDQAKAIKELEGMSIRNLKEEVAITQMMRGQNRSEEERLKAENVQISASVAGAQPQEVQNAEV